MPFSSFASLPAADCSAAGKAYTFSFLRLFFLVFFFSLELYLLLLFFEKSILFSCSNMSMNPCVIDVPRWTLVHALVENNGFEPLTPCLQSRCSSQLS